MLNKEGFKMTFELIMSFITCFYLGLLTMEEHMETKARKEKIKKMKNKSSQGNRHSQKEQIQK